MINSIVMLGLFEKKILPNLKTHSSLLAVDMIKLEY